MWIGFDSSYIYPAILCSLGCSIGALALMLPTVRLAFFKALKGELLHVSAPS